MYRLSYTDGILPLYNGLTDMAVYRPGRLTVDHYLKSHTDRQLAAVDAVRGRPVVALVARTGAARSCSNTLLHHKTWDL